MYREVYREMDQFRKALDQVFGDWQARRMPFSRFSFLPGIAARQYPLINIYEDRDSIFVECLAPGINPETLEVSMQHRTLTLVGEKMAVANNKAAVDYHRSERAAGKFVRTIEIKSDVMVDKITAEYKNGILMITLPKSEEVKPRRIAITAG